MKIHFWGVRGSIPSPQTPEVFRAKIKEILNIAKNRDLKTDIKIESFINTLPFYLRNSYGSNTTCIEINDDNGNLFILDAGTGIRQLGIDFLKRDTKVKNIHLFLTHLHWDHIQGFPFFAPVYHSDITINFYSTVKNFHKIFMLQQNQYNFPIKLTELACKKKFIQLTSGKTIQINDIKIDYFPMNHPGGGTAYSFKKGNKKVVFTGDVEFQEEDIEQIDKFGDFFTNADVAIFDSQYSLEQSFSKFEWGHTSYSMAVNLGVNWKIKQLFLTHHDPSSSDDKIMQIEKLAKEQLLSMSTPNINIPNMKVMAAYEGLELKI